VQKNLHTLVAIAVSLTVVVGPWRSEAQPMPGGQSSPSVSGESSVEGKVKKVNPAARRLDVSMGTLGLWDKTLEVTEKTQIQTDGQRARLVDIPEGAKVKASYETRAGKSFATRIDLYPPNEAPSQTEPVTQ
jgi:Cu/Ag efflux protein CusF